MASSAGVIVSVRGEERFLPALIVHSVHSQPRLSPVPLSLIHISEPTRPY